MEHIIQAPTSRFALLAHGGQEAPGMSCEYYELLAVINNHYGDASYGHYYYTAFARDVGRDRDRRRARQIIETFEDPRSGTMMCFWRLRFDDDSRVTPTISPDEVQLRHAYILFYARRRDHLHARGLFGVSRNRRTSTGSSLSILQSAKSPGPAAPLATSQGDDAAKLRPGLHCNKWPSLRGDFEK